MRLSSISTLAAAFVLNVLIFHASASTAAVSRPTSNQSPPTNQCSSQREEEQILCAASQQREESIKQVIDEDETVNSEPQAPSGSGTDVWKAAYDQWILGKKTKGKTKAVNRAIEEALKRNPETEAPKRTLPDVDLPELGDDELTVITSAVHNISSESAPNEAVLHSLAMIEDLCYSGDNGRQMAASGGVPHLIRLATLDATSVPSIRALATCAQNNPIVFDAAVEAGAISVLLRTIGVDHSVRAASLRALVAIGDSENALRKMTEERDRVVRVVLDSLNLDTSERRRCVIRALALVESCVIRDAEWKQHFLKAGIVDIAQREMKNGDVDVREGAARVLRLLR